MERPGIFTTAPGREPSISAFIIAFPGFMGLDNTGTID